MAGIFLLDRAIVNGVIGEKWLPVGPGTWSFQEMSSFSLLSGGSWVSMGPGTTRGLGSSSSPFTH